MLGAQTAERHTKELAVLGVSPKAHGVLMLLRARGAQSQSDLSQAMGASASTIVAVVDSLEAAGAVVRRGDPRDRRRNVVTITDQGRQTAERADTIADRLDQELMAPLEAREQAALRSWLQRIRAAGTTEPTPSQ